MINGIAEKRRNNFNSEKPPLLTSLERICESSGKIADFLIGAVREYIYKIQSNHTSIDEARGLGKQIKENLEILKKYLPNQFEKYRRDPKYGFMFVAF